MWFVPTRNRPDRLQMFLDACVKTHMHMPGLIVVDGHDGGDYSGVKLPENWELQYGRDHLETCGRMDEYFRSHPYASFYSIVNDDVVPLTEGWDVHLSNLAGDWNVVYPDDCNNGERMATQFMIGGKLARAVGSLGLGFLHTQVDRAWMDIGRAIDRLIYVPEVKLRHDHWATGRSEKDETYSKMYNGRSTIKFDRLHYQNWSMHELPNLVSKVKDLIEKG